MPVSPIAELIIQQDTVVLAVFLGGSKMEKKMEKKMPDRERIDDARSYRIVSTPTNKGEAVIAAVIVERAVKAGWVPESVLYDDSIGHDVIADMIEGVFGPREEKKKLDESLRRISYANRGQFTPMPDGQPGMSPDEVKAMYI